MNLAKTFLFKYWLSPPLRPDHTHILMNFDKIDVLNITLIKGLNFEQENICYSTSCQNVLFKLVLKWRWKTRGQHLLYIKLLNCACRENRFNLFGEDNLTSIQGDKSTMCWFTVCHLFKASFFSFLTWNDKILNTLYRYSRALTLYD